MLLKRNLDSVEDWIDSYFESLAKGSRWSVALALKQSNLPKALYRYRSLERLAYILEELRDGYVFLSNPADFNDPYDSALSTSYEQVEKQILEKWGPEYGFDSDAISKFFESRGEKERELDQWSFDVLVEGILSVYYGRGAVPDNQNFFSIFRNLIRISCFTTNPNSVVMWSHYANQHKGICVEYSGSSTLSNARFLELLHPVRYTGRLLDAFQLFSSITPEIALDQTPPPTLSEVNFDPWPILAACHKSEEWEYEKEWRLISSDPATRKAPKFSPDPYGIKPSRIILGARIDRAEQAAIEELAQKISVPVVNARLAKDRFEIEF